VAKKDQEQAPEAQPVTDWQPDSPEARMQGVTAEQLIASKNPDQKRRDAFVKEFVLQTNRVALEDLTSDESHLRGMAQQVINEALYKGLHAKAEPKLEDVSVVHEGLTTQSVKFTWSVKVIPAVLDLDPSKTVDKVQDADEQDHRDPVVSREAKPAE